MSFVKALPLLVEEDGIFHAIIDDKHFYWRPSLLRAFAEDARRQLAEFDRERREVVPFRRKG